MGVSVRLIVFTWFPLIRVNLLLLLCGGGVIGLLAHLHFHLLYCSITAVSLNLSNSCSSWLSCQILHTENQHFSFFLNVSLSLLINSVAPKKKSTWFERVESSQVDWKGPLNVPGIFLNISLSPRLSLVFLKMVLYRHVVRIAMLCNTASWYKAIHSSLIRSQKAFFRWTPL